MRLYSQVENNSRQNSCADFVVDVAFSLCSGERIMCVNESVAHFCLACVCLFAFISLNASSAIADACTMYIFLVALSLSLSVFICMNECAYMCD